MTVAAQAPGNAWPEDSARRSMAWGATVIGLFFGVIGTWAAFARLDSAALANAVVKVEGNRKSVQHQEGGVVKELRVKEGDTVREGQVLLVLDNPQAEASYAILRKQHLELLAQDARLQAERSGAARIAFPDVLTRSRADAESSQVMRSESAMFDSRRATLQGQIALTRKRIQQAREQILGFRAQFVSQQKQLASTREELEGLRDLFKRGYVPRQRMMELDRQAAALEGQAADSSSQAVRLGQFVEELELQVAQANGDRLQQVDNELHDVHAKLLELLPRLQAAKDVVDHVALKAPYAGRVVGLSVFGVGAVIGKGERIMEIVPEGSELIVEAQLGVDDIRDMRQGLRAEVRFNAYRQRTVPVIYGTVSYVSADRLTDSRTGTPYYLVQVRIPPKELERLDGQKLVPGMSAEVSILTGARTALDYVIRPLTDTLSRSFRQR